MRVYIFNIHVRTTVTATLVSKQLRIYEQKGKLQNLSFAGSYLV